MERCPTCGARHAGGPSCHRCRTDLRQVLAVERAAGPASGGRPAPRSAAATARRPATAPPARVRFTALPSR